MTVHFYFALDGAIVLRPTNGAFLGSYDSGSMTYYPDAAETDILNPLFEMPLAHTFTAAEADDVRDHGLFVRLYVLADSASGYIPTQLNVAEIDWQ